MPIWRAKCWVFFRFHNTWHLLLFDTSLCCHIEDIDMKALLLAAVVLGLCTPVAQGAEPTWNKKTAAARLDERAKWWLDSGISQRATDAKGKTACLSCHTTVPYALARPLLGKVLADKEAAPLDLLLNNIDRRLEAGPGFSDLYDFDENKKKESRGTEAILSTLILAWGDAARNETAPTPATKKAFERLWETQQADGSWDWFRFNFEPWETRDSQYYGAAQAAFAVGLAPGYYTADRSPALEQKVEALRKYLAANRDKKNLHSEAWLLLASTKLKGVLTREEQTQVVAALKEKQKSTGDGVGGWVLLDLANWRYNGAAPPKTPPLLNPAASNPDGYATGLVAFALFRAGVKTDDPKLAAAIKWLNQNQRTDGSWPAVSINVNRKAGNVAEFFMSDAATAWAVIALHEAETTK
jgi:squalene-hopene/tetraprenyl-beta-curcumene cyclase